MVRILKRRRKKWHVEIEKNGEHDKMTDLPQKAEEVVLPDMMTLAKIFMLASKRSYQPILLFALLLNELQIIPSMLSLI